MLFRMLSTIFLQLITGSQFAFLNASVFNLPQRHKDTKVVIQLAEIRNFSIDYLTVSNYSNRFSRKKNLPAPCFFT